MARKYQHKLFGHSSTHWWEKPEFRTDFPATEARAALLYEFGARYDVSTACIKYPLKKSWVKLPKITRQFIAHFIFPIKTKATTAFPFSAVETEIEKSQTRQGNWTVPLRIRFNLECTPSAVAKDIKHLFDKLLAQYQEAKAKRDAEFWKLEKKNRKMTAQQRAHFRDVMGEEPEAWEPKAPPKGFIESTKRSPKYPFRLVLLQEKKVLEQQFNDDETRDLQTFVQRNAYELSMVKYTFPALARARRLKGILLSDEGLI